MSFTAFLCSLDITVRASHLTFDDATLVATVDLDIRLRHESVAAGSVMVAPGIIDRSYVGGDSRYAACGDSPDQWVDRSLLDWIDEVVTDQVEGEAAQDRERVAFLSLIEAEASAVAQRAANDR